jgi:3-oxoacyl-[acyl-carrier-protein] synthase-1
MTELCDRLGGELPAGSGILAGGRCAVTDLMRNAQAQIGTYPVQIIIGVESFLSKPIIDHYIKAGRLMCAANSSGFIPGEAATGLIITAADATDLPQLKLTGHGTAHEDENAPAVTALTTAIRKALAMGQIKMSDVCALVSDLNGEHAKFKEASIAGIRLDRLPEGGSKTRPLGYYEHWNVVETIGEVGAAVLPAAIGLAFEAGRMGQLGGPHVLFHAGEDNGRRDAIIGEFTP